MSTPPVWNPLRLDVAALAERGAALEGQWPLEQLTRVMDDAPQPSGESVRWAAQGALKPVKGGVPQVRLRLEARATVERVCQRCLQPVALPLQVQREFVFVKDEDEAAALDADSDDDVLTLTRSLNLQELVEDELLLELPLVPRHDRCPQALEVPASVARLEGEADSEAPAHPFAVLAQLKRGE